MRVVLGKLFGFLVFIGPMAMSAVGSYGGLVLVFANVLSQGVSFAPLVVNSSASVTVFGDTECWRCELLVQDVAPLRLLTFWSGSLTT